jgi:hypothetical protein
MGQLESWRNSPKTKYIKYLYKFEGQTHAFKFADPEMSRYIGRSGYTVQDCPYDGETAKENDLVAAFGGCNSFFILRPLEAVTFSDIYDWEWESTAMLDWVVESSKNYAVLHSRKCPQIMINILKTKSIPILKLEPNLNVVDETPRSDQHYVLPQQRIQDSDPDE